MIRAIVIADSGAVMAHITAALSRLEHVEIAAYAAGRAPVVGVVRAVDPDLVLLDEMAWPGIALARLAEIRRAAPEACVIGLAEHDGAARRLAGGRVGPGAVVDRAVAPERLAAIVDEALAARNRTSGREDLMRSAPGAA